MRVPSWYFTLIALIQILASYAKITWDDRIMRWCHCIEWGKWSISCYGAFLWFIVKWVSINIDYSMCEYNVYSAYHKLHAPKIADVAQLKRHQQRSASCKCARAVNTDAGTAHAHPQPTPHRWWRLSCATSAIGYWYSKLLYNSKCIAQFIVKCRPIHDLPIGFNGFNKWQNGPKLLSGLYHNWARHLQAWSFSSFLPQKKKLPFIIILHHGVAFLHIISIPWALLPPF